MPVSWLKSGFDLKKLGIPSKLPPISFAPPPVTPAPGTNPKVTQPTAPIAPPASTTPTAGKASTPIAPPLTPPGQSSILSPFGSVPTIPGVSAPAAQQPAAAGKLAAATVAPPIIPPVDPNAAAKAAAAGAGKAAASSSAAAGAAGQAQQSTQATAENVASNIGATTALDPKDPNVIMDRTTGQLRKLTPAEITDRAAHQGAGAASAAASAAAGVAGQKQEQAQAGAMATASNQAAKPAAAPATPTTVSTPTNTTNPDGTPTEPSEFNKTLTKYMDTLNKWAEGMPDQQYKNALNQIITSSSLMDQAEKDALQMQINQDPALRGQGAGLAMMQIMARDHGFNLDQALAKASGDSLDRIINMQKYGIEQGTRIVSAIRDAKLEDAKIALENAQTARNNTRQDIADLTSSGQFEAAAAAMNAYMKDAFPGLNMNITAASLKSRDPQELTKMTQKLNFIKDLVGKNRAAALPLIQSMMSDPAFDGYFPQGMTADQIADTLGSGQISENITQANDINTQINSIAVPGADGKSQSFDETGTLYDDYFKLSGRDAVKEGRKLSLEDINTVRGAENLPAFKKDAQGNLVDENGVPLDDQDYKELAYRKDYYDKQQAAKTTPWVQKKNLILNSPLGKYFTNQDLYPGANDSLDKFLMASTLAADAFTTDPSTGEIVPNWDKLNLSLSSPEMWPIFHNWPSAVFAADGTVQKDAAGNPISTSGGYVYGEPGPDGKPVLSTPEDQKLDSAYFAYRNSAGTLNPTEWYFATQGGKTAPDPTKIPAGVKTGENFTSVGAKPTTPTTPATPGTGDALTNAQAKVDEIIGRLPAKVDADSVKSTLEQAAKGTFSDNDIREKLARFPGAKAAGVYDPTDQSHAAIGSKPTQEAKDFIAYNNLVESGVPEKDAADLITQTIGADRFNKAYKMLTGKAWGGAGDGNVVVNPTLGGGDYSGLIGIKMGAA